MQLSLLPKLLIGANMINIGSINMLDIIKAIRFIDFEIIGMICVF